MSLNTTCSQKQHWRHFVILLFWGQCYVVSDSMCYCVWSHFVVFGATVLCCDLKRDWEHILWLRTLCGVFFWCCNHSTNNAPSNSITAQTMPHPTQSHQRCTIPINCSYFISDTGLLIINEVYTIHSLLQSPLWFKAAVWLDHLSWRLKRRLTICWAGAFSTLIRTVPWEGRGLLADTKPPY